VPNIVMCVLNIAYNWRGIIRDLGPDAQAHFIQFQIVGINLLAYTIGLGYVVYSRGRMLGVVARLAGGKKVEPPPSDDMLRRCLTFGGAVGVVTGVLWGLSGFILPAWLQLAAEAESQLTFQKFAHWIVSQLLCGMIAATQSYYVVAFLSVRYCYPWLLQSRVVDASAAAELGELARRGRVVLGFTVAVPFIALMAAGLINFDRLVILALGGVGLAGCGLAYLLDLNIRGDVAALAAAINPSGDPLFATDSVDSFTTRSRR
jgi:hypothetical protein